MTKNHKSKRRNVNIFKRKGSPYYYASYFVKVRNEDGTIRSVQRLLSTQTEDGEIAQQRANQKREEDIARYHDNKRGPAINVRDNCPTCGKIVDLYLASARNKSSQNTARNFLTVVAEGAMILGDEKGREKAREIKVSDLTIDHLVRWKNQEARKRAKMMPRTKSNVNFYMRTAKSIFSNQDVTETFNGLNLPLMTINAWRKVKSLPSIKNKTFRQIPKDTLDRMDRRAKKFFLRVAGWFKRRATRPGRQSWEAASDMRWANQFYNAHAAYWLIRRGGLRNSEVQELRWDWFKFDEEENVWRIHLIEYPYWKPKGIPGDVPIATDLYEELVSLFGPVRSGQEGYVLKGTKDHRDDGTHRAPSLFCRKFIGGDRDKSLYELRKQAGSIVAVRDGIEAASKFLRHADFKTTWDYYIDLINYRKTVKPL